MLHHLLKSRHIALVRYFILPFVLFFLPLNGYAKEFEIHHFADPSAYTLPDGRLVLSSTNQPVRHINVPMLIGKNLDDLQGASIIDAMPNMPSWVSGQIWGSEIAKVNDGYAVYFSAKNSKRGIHCIGVAKSRDAAGPYNALTDEPLICPSDIKGAIDPAVFHDSNGALYLLYKLNIKGGGRNPKTAIWIVQLDQTGTSLVGESTRILRADTGWEMGNIESPTLIYQNGIYYLFYSGAYFDKPGYGIGFATSRELFGPYRKSSSNPIVSTDTHYFSPGSQAITRDKCGNILLFFHAYANITLTPPRNTYVKRIIFENEQVKLLNVDPSNTCP